MAKNTDIRVTGAALYFLPVQTRVPLKFGPETLTSVTCARACVRVTDRLGRSAIGWGETPLSVQWVWPATLSYEARHGSLEAFTITLAKAWPAFDQVGHPIELGHDFIEFVLPTLQQQHPKEAGEAIPHLAALVCCSLFDLAIHDAYGKLHNLPTYETYGPQFLSRDLGEFISPAPDAEVQFRGKYPCDFIAAKRPVEEMLAWHLVGGLDPIDAADLKGTEPKDGYPVLLGDWIETDGLKCLKVKLRGNDSTWDYQRLVRVGQLGIAKNVWWLSADFNCTVSDPAYVVEILDRLKTELPRIYGMLLYVEQPFPYDLERHRIDVHGVSARKPLFLDESAHDWRYVRLGRSLGWTGVALKTCKTQTGAVLSACWAKAHGMTLMVQDLTNPMLAQIPHCLLAAHTGTIMGVETNAMQFYPKASAPEAVVHPGLYRRSAGQVSLTTIQGPGFGYQLDRMMRELPIPEFINL
ncbi:MAG: enolase C-terminal domain-like protein [Verrucomicrobiota bacterium]